MVDEGAVGGCGVLVDIRRTQPNKFIATMAHA